MSITFYNGTTQSKAALPRTVPVNAFGTVMTERITLPLDNTTPFTGSPLSYYRLARTNKIVMGSATCSAFTNTTGGTNPTYLNGYGYIYPPAGFNVGTDLVFFIVAHKYQQFTGANDANDRFECDYTLDVPNNRIRFTAYNSEQLNPSEINYLGLYRKSTLGPI